MKQQSQAINITIPKQLLQQVDELAKHDFTSRSDIIRQSLLDRIRRSQSVSSDAWGDEGKWETIVDLSDTTAGGISASDFVSRLKELDGQNR